MFKGAPANWKFSARGFFEDVTTKCGSDLDFLAVTPEIETQVLVLRRLPTTDRTDWTKPAPRYLPFVLQNADRCLVYLPSWWWWDGDRMINHCTPNHLPMCSSSDFLLQYFCVVFLKKESTCILHCYKLATVWIQMKCNDSCLAPLRWNASSQSRLWITGTFSWKHTPDSSSLLSKLPHLFQSIQAATICNSTCLLSPSRQFTINAVKLVSWMSLNSAAIYRMPFAAAEWWMRWSRRRAGQQRWIDAPVGIIYADSSRHSQMDPSAFFGKSIIS